MKNLKKIDREGLKLINGGNIPPIACTSSADCAGVCCLSNGRCDTKAYSTPPTCSN